MLQKFPPVEYTLYKVVEIGETKKEIFPPLPAIGTPTLVLSESSRN